MTTTCYTWSYIPLHRCPGTQALAVYRADKIVISALCASSLVRNNISPSRPFHPPCHSSLFFTGSFAVQNGDHLRSGIICGPIWDHLRYSLGIICSSGIICGPGIICGSVQFGIFRSAKKVKLPAIKITEEPTLLTKSKINRPGYESSQNFR